jgi:hypothetical protein
MTEQEEKLEELRLANRSDPFVPYKILRSTGKPISVAWRHAVAITHDRLFVYPKVGGNIQLPIDQFEGLKKRKKSKR